MWLGRGPLVFPLVSPLVFPLVSPVVAHLWSHPLSHLNHSLTNTENPHEDDIVFSLIKGAIEKKMKALVSIKWTYWITYKSLTLILAEGTQTPDYRFVCVDRLQSEVNGRRQRVVQGSL